MTYSSLYFKRFWLFVLLCLLPAIAQAQNADEMYQLSQNRLKAIVNQAGSYKISIFNDSNYKNLNKLSSADKKLKKQYLEQKKIFSFWETVYRLKHDLIRNFNHHHLSLDEKQNEAMTNEADILAQAIIKRIEYLKKEYKIVGTPSLQNLLILAKIKKRGACKHWAQDLLETITAIKRDYFTAYWAEAHPGKITEHNVAVLVPQGAPFESGLIIDPWRRAGEPFWILVKDDPHPFKPWPHFQPR
ncbi:hypothetical protein K1X76_00020 [bacterium]|nr:hypothetical protein [bacterium]